MSFSDLFKNLSPAGLDADAHSLTTRSQTGAARRGRKRKASGEEQLQKRPCYRAEVNSPKKPPQYENNRSRQQTPGAGRQHNQRNQHNNKKWHKTQEKKNPNQPNRGGGYRNRGCGRRHGNTYRDVAVKPRFMSEEFIEQNALRLDGRLLCRHFLQGRCTKGEECQLEHIQAYNDLLKEACKFYIQGFCLKGETCPFMHKSIPCKFFHRRAKCHQGESCRFSHEPLTELTERLLDTLLKREQEHLELARRKEASEQPTSEQPEEVKPAEKDHVPEILLQPVRPSFYNSEGNAETCHETEEVKEDTLPPNTEEPPSSEASHVEPVCYSVEAMLGRQLSKPFPPLYEVSRSQESASWSSDVPPASMKPSVVASTEPSHSEPACLPQLFKPFPRFFTSDGNQISPDANPDSSNQSEAPYAVNTVLRSWKPVETASLLQATASEPVKSDLRDPEKHLEDISDHPVSCNSEKLFKKDEANKSLENVFGSLPPFRGHTAPPPPFSAGAHEKPSPDLSLKTVCRASLDVSALKPPERFVPHSDKEESPPSKLKPGPPESSSVPELQAGPADENSVKHRLPVKPLAEMQQRLKKSRPDRALSLQTSREALCRRTLEDLSPACKKTPSFYSLFSKPIASSASPVCPQNEKSERDDGRAAVTPEKSSSRPFLRLFNAPLRPEAEDNAFGSSNSHDGASNSRQTGAEVTQNPRTPTSLRPVRSPESKTSNQCSELLDEEPKAAPGGHSSSPALRSPRGSAAGSVLKTLFLCLSPFQEEVGTQSAVQASNQENQAKNRIDSSAQRQKPEQEKLSSAEEAAAASPDLQNSSGPRTDSDPSSGENLEHTSLPVQAGDRHKTEGSSLKGKQGSFMKRLFQSLDISVLNTHRPDT